MERRESDLSDSGESSSDDDEYKNSDDTSTGRKKTITTSNSNSITSKSIKDDIQLYFDSNSEENAFVSLTSEEIKEYDNNPEEYGYIPDFTSSSSVKLKNSKSKISWECKLKREVFSTIGGDKVNSAQKYESKLMNYNELIRTLDPIEYYSYKTGRTGGLRNDGKKYELNEFGLYLCLTNKKDRSYIENSFKLKRLPDIDILSIVRVKSNDGDTRVFLSHVSPQHLVKFVFGGNIKKKNNDRLCDICNYANSLEVVLRSTTKIVHFDNCSFFNTDLQTIIISASHINELEFYFCKFNIDEEFILSGVYQPKLERLIFNNCGNRDLSDWVVNTEILEFIVRAISITDFNDCLKELKIIDEGLEEDDVWRILNKCEFRCLDPIEYYTKKTKRTGSEKVDKTNHELKDFEFYLSLKHDKDRKVLLKNRRFKILPDIEKLSIDSVSPKDVDVDMFLKYVAPHKLQKFFFGGDNDTTNINELVEIKYYSKALHEVVKSTLLWVEFKCCSFNSSELQSIFRAAKHLKKLSFTMCRLDTKDDFDIGGVEYGIDQLCFSDCGDIIYSEWNYYPDKLEVLIGAISNSSLRQSLRKILVRDYSIVDKEVIQRIFEINNLQKVLHWFKF